jgi:hypothetical protein
LVPVGPKADVQQTFQTGFGKVPILKTAARQNDLCLSHPEGNSPDDLSQRVVKLRGNFASRPAAGDVTNYSFDRRAPINDEWRAIVYLERIGRVYPKLHRELEFHGSLSFETHPVPKVDQRGNGVE